MCGAATFLTQDNLQTLISDFRVARVNVGHDLRPNYNLRPTQNALLVRNVDGERVLEEARWWLVPHFEPEPKTKLTTFNARSDRLMQGMFRPCFLTSRALFLVDGYYEWLKRESPSSSGKSLERLPHRFLVEKGKHFALAGLYSLWKSRDGSVELPTCSVITTDANPLCAPVHDRMPVILDPASYDDWLDPQNRDPKRLQSLLAPFPADRMTMYPVSTFVNSNRNNSPECIAPLERR
ncbi:MAG: SOS response-associated peptidase [Armatimonadetes bacterium]|nr:SOS response-associated peptidase [Armatimonadota bacterium]